MSESSGEKARYVRYVGTAHRRLITAAQWTGVGAKDQKQTIWSVRNGWKIPVEEFSDNALQYFEKDAGFVVDAGEKASSGPSL